jgi:hypothetical protein
VFRQYIRCHAIQPFGAGKFDQPLPQLRSQSVSLEFVAGEHGKLRVLRLILFAEAPTARISRSCVAGSRSSATSTCS